MVVASLANRRPDATCRRRGVLHEWMGRRVLIVGAGVAGSAVAAELGAVDGVEVTVVERGPAGRLVGSTGHAPGFVGLLGEAAVLTQLADRSVQVYGGLHFHGVAGFDRVGGLEVAQSSQAWDQLQRRAGLAAEAGLPAQLLEPQETVARAPDLVDPDGCVGGLLFARDGTARARVITAALQERARSTGVRFVYDTPVEGISAGGGGTALMVHAGGQHLQADDVVLACGIWGQQVAALVGVDLPLVPVAHPYVHGPLREPAARSSPFVRWPEHHVYARDHGDRLGLGGYDHTPVPVPVEQLRHGAELPWPASFDDVVHRALRLLPQRHRFTVDTRLNGVFAMTADNQPLLGPVSQVPGLWVAQALWVTHAAGAAQSLVRAMVGQEPLIDGLEALLPDRFRGRPHEQLHEQSLRLYRDIYTTA